MAAETERPVARRTFSAPPCLKESGFPLRAARSESADVLAAKVICAGPGVRRSWYVVVCASRPGPLKCPRISCRTIEGGGSQVVLLAGAAAVWRGRLGRGPRGARPLSNGRGSGPPPCSGVLHHGGFQLCFRERPDGHSADVTQGRRTARESA